MNKNFASQKRGQSAKRTFNTIGATVAGTAALAYGTLLGGSRSNALVQLEDARTGEGLEVKVRVVQGLPRRAYPRGGVCIGDTFLTGRTPSTAVLKHEARHVLQWRKFGLAMPLLYWGAGRNPLTNRFEVEAGLEDGGYT